MHKLILASVFLSSLSLNAQQIPQQVINASGSHFSNNGIQLTSNVGEPITTLLSSTDNVVTQGFVQPIKTDVPTALREFAALDNNFTLYPNPSVSSVFLTFNTDLVPLKRVDVYANDGRLVLSQTLSNSTIDVSSLTDGIYWLRPISDEKQFGLKKLVKTH
jgi:Secretion system C-terminal sorting domain